MGTTTRLEDVLPPPNPELIEDLRNLLRQAESGDLQGLAYVCAWRPGVDVSGSWYLPESARVFRVVAELESLKLQLLLNGDMDVKDMVRRAVDGADG